MKKFTVTTKDGSKWLSRTAPHGVDPIQWHSDNHDLPYIGSAEPGTSLSEEQVKEIRQFMIGGTIDWDNTITEQGDWITMHDIDRGRIEADLPDFLKRTVYIDAESHDRHISKFMPLVKLCADEMREVEYWKKRTEAAEKLIGISPSDPKVYDEFCRIREEWEQIIAQNAWS